MASSWITYEQFNALYPDAVAEADFPALAGRAAGIIEDRTHWRAAVATDTESLAALAGCQAQLIVNITKQDAADAEAGNGAVTGYNNDGYSESYTSQAVLRTEHESLNLRVVQQALGAPSSKWMLYQGGVYHPAARP